MIDVYRANQPGSTMANKDDEAGRDIARKLRQQIPPTGIRRDAIMDAPAFAAATLRMGAGDLQAAADIAASLLDRYPGHPEAMFTLAMAGYWHAEQTPEAAAVAADMLERVVAARPGFAIGWYNLGFLRQRQGRDADAIAHYERCLSLDPAFVGAHVNLGNARLWQGDIPEAIACFTRATKHPTADTLAIYNRAIAYLLTGQWVRGWQDYETRWRTPLYRAKFPAPDLPVWDGTPPADGARLLVFSEQGYGDTIMCARYRRTLTERFPAGVTWYVQAPLASLLDAVPDTEPYPDADLCLPTMSLMHRLGMPADGAPYLPRVVTADRNGRIRVGYVWAGSTTHENDARRSTDRALWDGLLATPGVEWVDLQVGRGGTYAPADWRETAALVGTLDLVITVDTATAHLAGAMGVPVWILLPAMPDYRWGLASERTVWYDSARLFRQPSVGAWPEVLARVASALREWTA